jgi:hypothetical protein
VKEERKVDDTFVKNFGIIARGRQQPEDGFR